jgi:hypothetical protein
MTISLLDVYLSKSIPQNFLLTERGFERYARDRGINIGREELEFFKKLRLLFPLCRLKLPIVEEYCVKGEARRSYAPLFDISHNLSKWYEDGLCEDPAKTKFRPWKEYMDGYHETARALYHPWQFVNLKTIVHRKKFLGSQKGLMDFIVNRVNRDLRFLPLLISIEDVYLPIIRHIFKGVIGQPDHGFQIWRSLRSNFDPKEELSKFNLTIDEIKNWRTQIAVETSFLARAL